jgi:hypothetical protein
MPKIVRFHEVGGPEVLRIEEETPKQPGRGEVRLKGTPNLVRRGATIIAAGADPARAFLKLTRRRCLVCGRAWHCERDSEFQQRA